MFIGAAMAISVAADPNPRTAPSARAFVTDGIVKINTYFFGAGFESSEGFTLGSFDGQGGWAASGTSLPFASIAGANPFTGSQHLRMIHDSTLGQGAQRVALSPQQPTAANTASTVYMKIAISNDGGAEYDVVGQAPTQGSITWRVKFSWTDDTGAGPGTIFILDNTPTGLGYVSTHTQWAPGIYKELRVDFDAGGGVTRYYYDEALIYTGSHVSGTAVEQIAILHDNFQKPNETADFDALSVQTLGEPAVAVKQTSWGEFKAMMR
jgi:hypothetical protein